MTHRGVIELAISARKWVFPFISRESHDIRLLVGKGEMHLDLLLLIRLKCKNAQFLKINMLIARMT